MNVAVAVAVAVALTPAVSVAALVNGNDIVNVFDACDDHGSMSFVGMATMRSFTGVITATASFPFTSAATLTGVATATATATVHLTGLRVRS